MAASSGARLLFGNSARRWLRDLTKLLPKVLRLQLHLERSSQMARRPEHGACSRRALSPYDPRQDRALASDAQEPHPARELLPAGRSRNPDRGLRRRLQSPAISREHQQPDARRRLLRARPDHSDRKGKDQTTDNRQSPLAAPPASRIILQTRGARDSLILSHHLSQKL